MDMSKIVMFPLSEVFGGLGAQGIALVENGVVESIQITEPGAGYVEAQR